MGRTLPVAVRAEWTAARLRGSLLSHVAHARPHSVVVPLSSQLKLHARALHIWTCELSNPVKHDVKSLTDWPFGGRNRCPLLLAAATYAVHDKRQLRSSAQCARQTSSIHNPVVSGSL